MTDSQLTYIQALIDRSGSMQSIRSDAEGGFDAFIAEQRDSPGRCRVSLAQFDTEYQVVSTDMDVCDVPLLRIEPRGATAMLDAIGRTINDLGRRLADLSEDQRPGAVIVGIITDGQENASTEFSYQAIKKMIEHQEQVYSWTFLYMGADQDAIEQGAKMGIQADRAMTYGRDNSKVAYAAMSASIGRVRAARFQGVPPEAAAPLAGFRDEDREQAR